MKNARLYFIATPDRSMVKIGCSEMPESRLAFISTWSPYPVELIGSVPGTPNDERSLHARYAAQHVHHEWFRSTPEMLADIAAIVAAGELPEAFRPKGHVRNPFYVNLRNTPEWRAKMSEIQKASWLRRNAPPAQGQAA